MLLGISMVGRVHIQYVKISGGMKYRCIHFLIMEDLQILVSVAATDRGQRKEGLQPLVIHASERIPTAPWVRAACDPYS